MAEVEVEKGPACRQADESYKECVSRKVSELIGTEGMESDQAIAVASSMCETMCSEKAEADSESSRTPTREEDAMSHALELENPTVITDESKFDSISIEPTEVEVHYRIVSPFTVVEKTSKAGDNDVTVTGPIYVGSDEVLDRHGELVDTTAIMSAWDEYRKNPVILYNHSKTYGVIGKMEKVKIGEFNGMQVPIGTAIIDGGEKDIVRKIRKGFLKAFSIGFIARGMVKVCDDDDDECYLRFTDIDWLETSIVDVPASPDALFSVEKSVRQVNVPQNMDDDCGCGSDCCDENVKEMVEVGGQMGFTSPEEAIGEARRIGCVPPVFHTIWDEKNGRTVYLPCRDRAAQDEAEAKQSAEKEMLAPDVFTTEEEALARAGEIGCAGVHGMEDESGYTVFMPCSTHAEYESTIASAKSESNSASLNNPLASPVESMTADEMEMEVTEQEVTEVSEAPIEEAIEDPIEQTKEAIAEDTVADEADEVPELPKPLDVLLDVATSLKAIDERLTAVESSIAPPADEPEVAELKAAIAEKDEELATIAQEKAAKDAQDAYEAEITARVQEVLSSYGIEAERKTATPDENEPSTDTTRFDPQPETSKGMNGLADWLEANLIARG